MSPPRALKSEDWKDWPSEGLHEKPFYNPSTKRLHHFDKNVEFTSKLEDDETQQRTSKIKAERKLEVNDDLATSTHKCLHSVLRYIVDIKQFNTIREKAKKHYLGEFWSLFTSIASGNVCEAREVLLDTCKLYCLCNGVSENDMVRYIDSLSARDLDSDFGDAE